MNDIVFDRNFVYNISLVTFTESRVRIIFDFDQC